MDDEAGTSVAYSSTDWYFRRKGHPLVKLPDPPHNDPKFLAAYAAAAEAAPATRRAPLGSISGLIEAAIASDRYLSRSKVYRATLRRHFEAIKEQAGTAPAMHLLDRHIRADVERSINPTDRRKAWRFLCDFGVADGVLDKNPSQGVEAPRKPATEGFPPWAHQELEAFRARWKIGTTKRAAFELLHWTGLRIGDAVKIGPGHIDRRGVLVYSQSKVKKPAYIPWTAALPASVAECAPDRDFMHRALDALNIRQMAFLATTNGASRSEKWLGNMIREAAREAGVAKSAHGLRKSRGIALAEAGLSAHGIMSWLGHQTLKEAQHYTEEADRWRAVMGANEERTLQPDPRHVATTKK
ncbi:MAG: tyrosine-type recombinase/integrase [Rhodobacter sp.]|nr:tyrosine-type recombinase/integrase [Rhodobacter sp.]